MTVTYNKIANADCIRWLRKNREPFADLIFADPPFNIGYKYDVYEDRRAYDEYYTWTFDWMKACADVLKPTGCFWVAIGDEYAAEVRMIGRKLELTLRNWGIWHFTFGQQTKAKFARSHVHLFYFVKDPRQFTFNDRAVRTFSDRQRVYRDVRANKVGKVPDDTWNEFPRVCGTWAEREGWHPCQMPETVLTRIVLSTSNVDDVVFDPFSGSGTTLAVAKRFSRKYLGTELSKEYAKGIRKRLKGVRSLASLDGAAKAKDWPAEHVAMLQMVYQIAAVSTESLYANRMLLEGLSQHFNWQLEAGGAGRSYTVPQVWAQLEALRRNAALGRIRIHAEEPRLGDVRFLD